MIINIILLPITVGIIKRTFASSHFTSYLFFVAKYCSVVLGIINKKKYKLSDTYNRHLCI